MEAEKSKRREDKDERRRRKREKHSKKHREKSTTSEQPQDEEPQPPSVTETPRNSLLTPDDDHIADRIVDAVIRPRITPAAQSTSASTETNKEEDLSKEEGVQEGDESKGDGDDTKGEGDDAKGDGDDTNEVATPKEAKTPASPFSETALRALIDAQYTQLSAQIEALEVYRQALVPFVSAEVAAAKSTRKRRAGPAASTPATKKRRSGYTLYMQVNKANKDRAAEWRALKPEQKKIWNDRAANEDSEQPATTPSTTE
eukprot:Gregarina_sp_Pseudo_9__5156@NODE_54_length_4785_cov_9_540244_g51_i0_p4_GENE_NODE_54_length_4785_cov_9_540244_g51_i0NODE_54_length_4785_cov_9_540244_g51_i0_p4_ORF_typecomplete_len258_score81_91GvpL_GvpF/PF06386_11/1_4e02GvpL_GvpF/PF06386_11/0_25HMG_box_2/PF09011_10/5_6e03HMG_box_2/PF09011_10/0_084HMG_box/PF00505_19/5_9e03HMG_box/PF00505_19/0_064_NODE_54_length_4785_cov_9_540244_g51_i010641837